MYFTVILWIILHKETTEKETIEIWTESARFNTTNLRFANQARTIWKRVLLSDLELQEICGHVSPEENGQDPSTRIAMQNTEEQVLLTRIETIYENQNTTDPKTINKI